MSLCTICRLLYVCVPAPTIFHYHYIIIISSSIIHVSGIYHHLFCIIQVLQELVMDIMRVLSATDLEVRKKTLDLTLDLVSSRNIDDVSIACMCIVYVHLMTSCITMCCLCCSCVAQRVGLPVNKLTSSTVYYRWCLY